MLACANACVCRVMYVFLYSHVCDGHACLCVSVCDGSCVYVFSHMSVTGQKWYLIKATWSITHTCHVMQLHTHTHATYGTHVWHVFFLLPFTRLHCNCTDYRCCQGLNMWCYKSFHTHATWHTNTWHTHIRLLYDIQVCWTHYTRTHTRVNTHTHTHTHTHDTHTQSLHTHTHTHTHTYTYTHTHTHTHTIMSHMQHNHTHMQPTHMRYEFNNAINVRDAFITCV